ncbi:hypothetical protein ACFRAO_07435 [Streptomyces sp. NPDC056656]|uniref:hypothetical protein n=1 Tax=Streptomyces sp. NPDC056656 TaxID=3345895 RepID=UPI0036BD4BB4
MRDRFPDGRLYVNLHGFDHDRQPLEPGEALELLLRSVGLAASEIPSRAEAQGRVFRTLLADRQLLILLANAASAEQVRAPNSLGHASRKPLRQVDPPGAGTA